MFHFHHETRGRRLGERGGDGSCRTRNLPISYVRARLHCTHMCVEGGEGICDDIYPRTVLLVWAKMGPGSRFYLFCRPMLDECAFEDLYFIPLFLPTTKHESSFATKEK